MTTATKTRTMAIEPDLFPGEWIVQSDSGNTYCVWGNGTGCNCPGNKFNGHCRHADFVEAHVASLLHADEVSLPSSGSPSGEAGAVAAAPASTAIAEAVQRLEDFLDFNPDHTTDRVFITNADMVAIATLVGAFKAR
jgi:hypothetical protein